MNNEDKEINKVINKIIDTTINRVDDILKDILNSKTFKASVYLIKYIESKDKTYFDKFMEIFKYLNLQEQVQVLCNVSAYLQEQENKKKEHEKVKVKDLNG